MTIGVTKFAVQSSSTPRPIYWCYGMGERPILDVVAGDWRRDRPCAICATCGALFIGWGRARTPPTDNTITLPSFDQVATDKLSFAEMTRIHYLETNPHNARRLVQYHDREAIVANPPALPLAEAEMDRVYGLPYTRRRIPAYGQRTFRP